VRFCAGLPASQLRQGRSLPLSEACTVFTVCSFLMIYDNFARFPICVVPDVLFPDVLFPMCLRGAKFIFVTLILDYAVNSNVKSKNNLAFLETFLEHPMTH